MRTECYEFKGNIIDVRLPCIDNYESLSNSKVRSAFHNHIWLSDIGLSQKKSVAVIDKKGKVNYNGLVPSNKTIGVQPTLMLCAEDFHVGDRVDIAGTKWIVIEKQTKFVTALCEDIIAYRRFDPKTNIWMVSEIHDWLDEWMSYLVDGLEEINYISFAVELPF